MMRCATAVCGTATAAAIAIPLCCEREGQGQGGDVRELVREVRSRAGCLVSVERVLEVTVSIRWWRGPVEDWT